MAQPSTIYKPGKLNYVWNYIGTTLKEFKAKLLGYRSYVAVVSQVTGNAPTAVVLENSIGDIYFTYSGTGAYYINSDDNLFTENKTVSLCTTSLSPGNIYFLTIRWDSTNKIALDQFDVSGSGADDFINATIEIRVYN